MCTFVVLIKFNKCNGFDILLRYRGVIAEFIFLDQNRLTATATPIQFSVVYFLENTKRGQKVKTPLLAEAFLSVTVKLAGRTIDTNRLALRVHDLIYLPGHQTPGR